jgi:hypothetical protein
MKENQTAIPLQKPNFTIIRKGTEESKPAKMVSFKRIGYRAQLLLPPPQEKYIKAKEHDFL